MFGHDFNNLRSGERSETDILQPRFFSLDAIAKTVAEINEIHNQHHNTNKVGQAFVLI